MFKLYLRKKSAKKVFFVSNYPFPPPPPLNFQILNVSHSKISMFAILTLTQSNDQILSLRFISCVIICILYIIHFIILPLGMKLKFSDLLVPELGLAKRVSDEFLRTSSWPSFGLMNCFSLLCYTQKKTMTSLSLSFSLIVALSSS